MAGGEHKYGGCHNITMVHTMSWGNARGNQCLGVQERHSLIQIIQNSNRVIQNRLVLLLNAFSPAPSVI